MLRNLSNYNENKRKPFSFSFKNNSEKNVIQIIKNKKNKEKSGIVRYKDNNKKESSGIVRYKDNFEKKKKEKKRINILTDIEITLHYEKIYEISENWYSKTYKCENKESGKLVMITKVIKVKLIEINLNKFFTMLLNKVSCLNHIIRIYEEDDFYYVVEDYLISNLSDSIKANIGNSNYLFQIQKILLQLKEVLEELNNNNIICGGFELEKIGFSSFFNDWKLKISPIMFLNSLYIYDKEIFFKSENKIPVFSSPELMKKDYRLYKSDIWSLGVLIYYLIFNEYPFEGIFEFNIFQKMISSDLKKPPDEDLADLLDKTFKLNIDERISINDFFNHSFFTNDYDNGKSI